ncbi:MAG TPA: hypothetical protein VNF99_06370 [Stellaceae bacterium]|nr:hypothetical protein [Stellaceae bacterium]
MAAVSRKAAGWAACRAGVSRGVTIDRNRRQYLQHTSPGRKNDTTTPTPCYRLSGETTFSPVIAAGFRSDPSRLCHSGTGAVVAVGNGLAFNSPNKQAGQ